MKEILETINKDIDSHRSDAGNMLAIILTATIVFLVLLFISFAPEIAARLLPEEQKLTDQKHQQYISMKNDFKKNFGVSFQYISKDDYEDLVDDGKATEKDKAARIISKMDSGDGVYLKALKLISQLSIEQGKIDTIFKIIPIIFAAVFGGCLLTYRTHILSAKELSLKKMDFLIQYEIDNKSKDIASLNSVISGEEKL